MKKFSYILKDLDCANCANKIQNKLSENENYHNVNVNFNTLRLTLESDLEDIEDDIKETIAKLEPEVEVIDEKEYKKHKHDHNHEHEHEHEHHIHKYEYILKDLDCANCANKIQNKLAENPDYENVNVNFNTLRLTLESAKHDIKPDIVKVIAELEPEVEVLDVDEAKREKKKIKKESKVNTNAVRLLLGLMFAGLSFSQSKYSICYIILAYVFLLARTTKNAIKLLKGKTIDENFLITISCIGAFCIGERIEGLMVIILYEIGKLLEEKAINNTRKSIADLMDIRPEYANLKDGDHDDKVDPDEVKIDDIIVVKQGEKIPLDGIVISGEAHLNTASLTGESALRKVSVNDNVISGSINEKGLIEVKVTKVYEDSTVSKILELVENATDKKAKTETFVNKASRIYTPIVLGLAILVGILTPILTGAAIQEGIYRTLVFLVVSCPCAIVISVPLSYFTGIGKASKNGILIKGSNYLDAIKDIKSIAFDKTGTLTKGEFGVEKILSYDKEYDEEKILTLAANAESYSNHPIAVAILKKYNRKIDTDKISNFEEVSGKGLQYKLDNKLIKVGNSDFINCEKENITGTIIYVAVDEKAVGALVLNDAIKEEAKETIKSLNKLGITTYMFTGDNKEVADKVGKELGIKKVKSELLPQDKYNEIEKMIKSKNEEKDRVAFVGDGINDSPVLALSDVGISMGGIGASSAIEASDVVIMTDNLSKIEQSIKISRYTNKIIKQNLVFALGVKLLVLGLTVVGLGYMWEAVFADVGVTLITIINTLRILKNIKI